MKIFFKLILVCILCLIGIVLLYVLYILIYPTITEYKPDKKTEIQIEQSKANVIHNNMTYSILTWNIGYAGLGSEMDFFYEGGDRVRPEKEEYDRYFSGISDFIRNNDSLDFILLQEVDFNAKRSHFMDQYIVIKKSLNHHFSLSATNYKSKFVPSPIFEPMGKVEAGQTTFSRHNYSRAERISTPGEYSWPMRLFMLKRCFLVSHIPVENGKSLVIFNIHNSAFDDAAELRKKELELLRDMAMKEYNKGNYVIIGGDWNQNPPGWDLPEISKYQLKTLWPINVDYLPENWNWGYDRNLPTNREVHEPFRLKSTPCTLLDFFATSPNITIQQLSAIDLAFENSDHLPVIMTFTLD